jgi:ribosomal protein L37AE/L43A
VASAWLVLAAGDDRQHGGNDGYLDEPAETYQWDDTVNNHATIAAGDAIVLWNKKALMGASVIERINEGSATKPVYRCAHCGGAHIKRRKRLEPAWRCFACKQNFDAPQVEHKDVHTYATEHDVGWVDLDGVLTPPELRELCVSPRSQLSLRPLRWDDFRSAVEVAAPGALRVVDFRRERIRGGHTLTAVRVRLGQGRFRRTLLEAHGAVCAITGPAPATALEAAHLYSYAAVGKHHSHGGFLLRRDVHRLFDLGQIAGHPSTLRIDVNPELATYPSYSTLAGKTLSAEVESGHRTWLAAHWAEHRGSGDDSAA